MTRRESRPHFEEELMLELLKGFPDNVTAFALHGHVTKDDYDDRVLIHLRMLQDYPEKG
jgi:hypothetical protein